MRNKLIYVVFILVLLSCNGFIIKKQVVKDYYLIATDVEEDLCLCYHRSEDSNNYATLIDATVFAIGFNNKYIIVKQHPRTFPNPPDTSHTNYYILPLKGDMNWRSKNGLMGPFTLEQFNDKCRKLNIFNLTFITVSEFLK